MPADAPATSPTAPAEPTPAQPQPAEQQDAPQSAAPQSAESPTAPPSATPELAAAQPATAQPATAQPAATPPTPEAGAAQPATAPAVPQSTEAQPAAELAAVAQSTAPQPTTAQPAASESAVTYPTVRLGRAGNPVWQMLIGGAAVLVLLAICGLGTVAVLMERRSATDPVAPPPATPGAASTNGPNRSILESRDTDPLPLTAKEVFPNRDVVIAGSQSTYRVLKTNSSASCAVAATGDIANLLVHLGCNQVVRGTVRTSDGNYLATAGLLNLTDQATAERVRDRIREMLQQRQGRFLALEAGEGTEALTTAASRVAWQVRGHYVIYCMVVRADGQSVGTDDQQARQVLRDLVERHLDQQVLQRRADGDLVQQPNPTSTSTTRTDPDDD